MSVALQGGFVFVLWFRHVAYVEELIMSGVYLEHFAYFLGPLQGCKLYLRYFTRCIFLLQVSGAGYNDQGEIHIHKCDSADRARESIYSLLEVRTCVTADGPSHCVLLGQAVDSRVAAH
jgi:hypothetical protein